MQNHVHAESQCTSNTQRKRFGTAIGNASAFAIVHPEQHHSLINRQELPFRPEGQEQTSPYSKLVEKSKHPSVQQKRNTGQKTVKQGKHPSVQQKRHVTRLLPGFTEIPPTLGDQGQLFQS